MPGRSITAAGRATGSTGSTKALQPWLVGLTAVVVFLFIVFILMIVNRLWCKKKRDENPESRRLEENVYDNAAMELDVEGSGDGERKAGSRPDEEKLKNVPEQKPKDEKITAM
ncbi:small integral membrane protein 24 isoform X2 [Ambystoma mexicanum]|uniref:small integral membrane protein 24 isoform X2 n=1 Tax=Ambystoma mexicanum TaxID=8296 RepID=UPI0037E846AC